MAITLPAAQAPTQAPADQVELLDGGAEAFPRMIDAIDAARATIYLEVYAFEPTGWGGKFIDALTAASKRGVRVRVIIDGWGSLLGGRTVVAKLREAGCEARIYNRFLTAFLFRLRRDHRKILLVDDEVAFLGGINIADQYASPARDGFADLALQIRGPACARLGKRLRREKLGAWSGAVHIHLSSESGGRKLRKRYQKSFAAARLQILVAHAYFLPDHGLVKALRHAARRGVDVKLLLAGRSDVPFAHAATMSLYRALLKAGVQIFEWTTSVLHAKVATIDHRRFLIGSFNLDPLSLSNLETLVELEDPEVVPRAESWIETHIATSTRVTAVDRSRWQRWVGDRLSLVAARLVQLLGRLLNARR